MEILSTPLAGLLVITPRIFTDRRGHFLETWNQERFKDAIGSEASHFVQDNESVSHRNVLRGLHYQEEPHAQGKLVHVVKGSVTDVVLDIRRESPTFGQHYRVTLDDKLKQMLWVPPGFAHGFVALEEHTVFVYKCTRPYHQPSERTILWNDPQLGIDWGVEDPIVSEKDAQGMLFASYQTIE